MECKKVKASNLFPKLLATVFLPYMEEALGYNHNQNQTLCSDTHTLFQTL